MNDWPHADHDGWNQVGRCVYCGCGARLFQGTLPTTDDGRAAVIAMFNAITKALSAPKVDQQASVEAGSTVLFPPTQQQHRQHHQERHVDSRSTEIIAQSTLKCAAEVCRGVDLSTPEGQAEFAIGYSFLLDLVMDTINSSSSPDQQAANLIRGNFPGTTNEPPPPANTPYVIPQQATPQEPAPYNGVQQYAPLSVKGAQHGPLPDWLFEAAAAKGVTEVYDNRDRAAANPKYPLFKSTAGGPNPPAFWAPGR